MRNRKYNETKHRNGNKQYKTVAVQQFARGWFSHQRSCRWTIARTENPTVSYCQRLPPMYGARYRK